MYVGQIGAINFATDVMLKELVRTLANDKQLANVSEIELAYEIMSAIVKKTDTDTLEALIRQLREE